MIQFVLAALLTLLSFTAVNAHSIIGIEQPDQILEEILLPQEGGGWGLKGG